MFRRLLLVLTLLVLLNSPHPIRAEEAAPSQCVVPSLMLHSHSAEFLPEFLDLLEERGYRTITYRELEQLFSGKLPQGKYVIISIDDFGPNRISSTLKEMVSEIRERDMVAVLGLVTGSLDQNSWDYLAELEKEGFEIASHTSGHGYLPGLSSGALKNEIIGSSDLISKHLQPPVSLVLPYGGFEKDSRIVTNAKEAGYKFIVGIAGGEKIASGGIYYVGRESPNIKSAEATLSNLEKRFCAQPVPYATSGIGRRMNRIR